MTERVKVAILDTSFSSLPLIDVLNRQNCDVFTVGGNKNDHLCMLPDIKHVQIDYRNPILVENFISDAKIDYILPGCNDVSYSTYTQVCTDAKISCAQFNKLNNKKEFRKMCFELGIPVPNTFNSLPVKSNHDCIVKPSVSFSGNGITRIRKAHSASARNAAILHAKLNSIDRSFVIEEFIEGDLFSISMFIGSDRQNSTFIVREFCTTYDYAVDWSYIEEDFTKKVIAQHGQAIAEIPKLLNIRSGLLHLQCILSNDNTMYVIEATTRCPGDLYPELIRLQLGFDYALEYVKEFVPIELLLQRQFQSHENTIIRHTSSSRNNEIFYGFGHHGRKVLLSIPTLKIGAINGTSNKFRSGVHFYSEPNKPTDFVNAHKVSL